MRDDQDDTRVIRNTTVGMFLSFDGKEVAEYPDAAKYPSWRRALNALKRQPDKHASDEWLIHLARHV